MKRVLNVAGGQDRRLPSQYDGWQQEILDINPDTRPDVLCDAREMHKLKGGQYDAIHCSHGLEHFYKHEVPGVLAGIQHVLKPDGFGHFMVPDIGGLVRLAAEQGGEIDNVWYRAQAGNVTFHDVLYGWGRVMAAGNLYYAHKCGFTEKSLGKTLLEARFVEVITASDGANLFAFAFKQKPSSAELKRLGL